MNIAARKPLGELIRERHPKLPRSILEPGFVYRNSRATDIRETFKRVRTVVPIRRNKQ
jgi:hypothetical protein